MSLPDLTGGEVYEQKGIQTDREVIFSMAPFFNILFLFKSSFICADFKNWCLKDTTRCYSLASLIRL